MTDYAALFARANEAVTASLGPATDPEVSDAAVAAYENALLDPMSQATVDQQLVQWKSLDLVGDTEVATADPAEAVEGGEEE